MKPQKVYVATEGSYSDYRVLAVFARREDAEEVGEEVLEMTVYPAIPRKVTMYFMSAAAPFDKPDQYSHTDYPWGHSWVLSARPRVNVWNNKSLRVYGTDREAVRKVFAERRAQLTDGAACLP